MNQQIKLAFLTTCEKVHVCHVGVPSSAKSETENTTKVVLQKQTTMLELKF